MCNSLSNIDEYITNAFLLGQCANYVTITAYYL